MCPSCVKLAEELAKIIKQRDALKDACKQIVSCKGHPVFPGSVFFECARYEAEAALKLCDEPSEPEDVVSEQLAADAGRVLNELESVVVAAAAGQRLAIGELIEAIRKTLRNEPAAEPEGGG